MLFSFCVQHLHKQRLRGSAATAMLQVQALLAPGSYVMDVWQYGQQFGKFVLQKTRVAGCKTGQSSSIKKKKKRKNRLLAFIPVLENWL